MNLLDQNFYGNRILTWFIAVAVLALTLVVLGFVKRVLMQVQGFSTSLLA